METLNDYLPTTPDLNAERLADLRRLWPDLFTDEGQPNPTAVQAALGLATPAAERYAFTWSGKTAARQAAFAPTTTTLVPDAARSFQPEKGRHAIIEGDNLQVLKLLLAGYRERVKCIYIDPPYNTGKDFVYSDNYTADKLPYWEQTGGIQEGLRTDTNPDTNGRYHSDWLSMMYSRLLLARQLLREDGVIFVSIDDNEMHNLRKVLDDVFGEENFVAEFVRRRRKTQANLALNIAPVHEYVLAYCKENSRYSFDKLPYSAEYIKKTFSNPDHDPRGAYQTGPLARPANSANKEYELTMPNGRVILGRWGCSQETFDQYVADNRLVIPRDGEGMPRIKNFLFELDGQLANTWLSDVASNDEAAKEIKAIFGSMAYFDYPKPTGLVRRLVELVALKDKETIVLDFFGGSGTTFQAVAELNKSDNGTRQCILVV